jgi:acyl-CoA hydrolase/GNAT superfamily N-acetyltransferase
MERGHRPRKLDDRSAPDWDRLTVSPDTALERLRPGMRLFVGTGAAEPQTLVRALMASSAGNLQDLELTQLVSFGDAVSIAGLRSQKYRLRTFFAGWVAGAAAAEGSVDLIPSRFARIPRLFRSPRIDFDAAFLQVAPPDASGHCSLGLAVDVARQVMEKADIVVGEINPWVPRTYGDTFVPLDAFHYRVRAQEPPIYLERWPVDPVFDAVAENVASVVEDGSCLCFSIGPLYEALARALRTRRDLGIHSAFLTDAAMDLVRCGAVTNRRKGIFRGQSVASYALGTPALMEWLHCNPRVAFHGVADVFDPVAIGRNPRFVAVFPARNADLSGRVVLHTGMGTVAAGPGEAADFAEGAQLSDGGRTVFAMPSRNRSGKANIRMSIERHANRFGPNEAADLVVTEQGVASLTGRSLRERAQAMIEVAHPDDRQALVAAAKAAKLLYPDQIFLADSARIYPADIAERRTFRTGLAVRFRAIKPSDEEEMRRLFYRFSDEAVYYRYFSSIRAMPHSAMQAYVNVDFSRTLSIVGLVGEAGEERIVAEARFERHPQGGYAEVAFVVDEAYQGAGIATYLLKRLIALAKARGIRGFTADVLVSNHAMRKVFEKSGLTVHAKLASGVYALTLPF